MTMLLPRASLVEVLRGRARLVGARCDADSPRGLVSPVEARLHLGIAYGDLKREEQRYLEQRSPASDAALLLRVAVTRVLARPGEVTEGRPFIVSARVDNLTVDEALDRIFAPPHPGRARMVHFAHPHSLTLAASDEAHAERLARADLVLPDGIGLRIAGRILGTAVPNNVNGTDLLPLLCARAVKAGVPLALIGAQPGVAQACADRLIAAHSGLRIPVVRHGYLDEAATAEAIAAVKALGRAVVLVGMGSPIQEAWAWKHLADAAGASVLTVGGLLDFYSGRIPRAPQAWRELGMEWAYRLAQEPRRMARRYLIGIPVFLGLVVRQRVASRKSS
jgi:N-acetylglucosaminyldiphosphoundecaprenol N-acetyl-beta-D-mannosaminyltransferase